MKKTKFCKKVISFLLITLVLFGNICSNTTNVKASIPSFALNALLQHYFDLSSSLVGGNSPVQQEDIDRLINSDSFRNKLRTDLNVSIYLGLIADGYDEETATNMAVEIVNNIFLFPSVTMGILKASISDFATIDPNSLMFKYILGLTNQAKTELESVVGNSSLEDSSTREEYITALKNTTFTTNLIGEPGNTGLDTFKIFNISIDGFSNKDDIVRIYIVKESSSYMFYYDLSNGSKSGFSPVSVSGASYQRDYYRHFKDGNVNKMEDGKIYNGSVPIFSFNDSNTQINYVLNTSLPIMNRANYNLYKKGEITFNEALENTTSGIDVSDDISDIEKVTEKAPSITGNELVDNINDIIAKAQALKIQNPELTDEEAVRQVIDEIGETVKVTDPVVDPDNPSGEQWTGLFSWLSAILNAIKSIPEVIRTIPTLIKTFINLAVDNIVKYISDLIELVKTIVNNFAKLLEYVKDIVEEQFPAIGVALTVVTDWLTEKKVELTDIWAWVKVLALAVPVALDLIGEKIGIIVDSVPLTLENIYLHVKDLAITIPEILTDIWDKVLSIPNYLDILERILAAVKAVARFWVLDIDNIKSVVGTYQKFTGFDHFTKVFNLYSVLKDFIIEYPKIEIDTPAIIGQFYKSPTIVLLDFGKYKDYCIWARRFFSACTWFAYFYGMIKKFRPKFVLNA